MRAVGVASSTRDRVTTLCGMVMSAPRRLVKRKICRSDAAKSSGLTPIGMTAASIPRLSNQGL